VGACFESVIDAEVDEGPKECTEDGGFCFTTTGTAGAIGDAEGCCVCGFGVKEFSTTDISAVTTTCDCTGFNAADGAAFATLFVFAFTATVCELLVPDKLDGLKPVLAAMETGVAADVFVLVVACGAGFVGSRSAFDISAVTRPPAPPSLASG
jgi:hypothetical protein